MAPRSLPGSARGSACGGRSWGAGANQVSLLQPAGWSWRSVTRDQHAWLSVGCNLKCKVHVVLGSGCPPPPIPQGPHVDTAGHVRHLLTTGLASPAFDADISTPNSVALGIEPGSAVWRAGFGVRPVALFRPLRLCFSWGASLNSAGCWVLGATYAQALGRSTFDRQAWLIFL